MAITLELPPEIRASLEAQARARGLRLDVYVESVLTKQVTTQHPGRTMSLEKFEAELDALAENSEKLPNLPAEAVNRESFYQDHD
jgi:hypothetical protein